MIIQIVKRTHIKLTIKNCKINRQELKITKSSRKKQLNKSHISNPSKRNNTSDPKNQEKTKQSTKPQTKNSWLIFIAIKVEHRKGISQIFSKSQAKEKRNKVHPKNDKNKNIAQIGKTNLHSSE
jgi:hypothetical protein